MVLGLYYPCGGKSWIWVSQNKHVRNSHVSSATICEIFETRLVCRYSYWRLGPNFCTWYYTKIVSFLFISLCCFCFCQQTVQEWESAELYDYKDSSNNKKWILEKGIGLFSFSHICNSVCHVSKSGVWAEQLSFFTTWKVSAWSVFTQKRFLQKLVSSKIYY